MRHGHSSQFSHHLTQTIQRQLSLVTLQLHSPVKPSQCCLLKSSLFPSCHWQLSLPRALRPAQKSQPLVSPSETRSRYGHKTSRLVVPTMRSLSVSVGDSSLEFDVLIKHNPNPARGTSEPNYVAGGGKFGIVVGDPVVSNTTLVLPGARGYPVQVSSPAVFLTMPSCLF